MRRQHTDSWYHLVVRYVVPNTGTVCYAMLHMYNVVKLKNFIHYFTCAEQHCDMLVFDCSHFYIFTFVYSELLSF